MNRGVLLSGGFDSIALTYWMNPDVAFTINYGQISAFAEIRASQAVCKALMIEHHIISVDCSSLGTGDLSTNEALNLAPASEWWPYRNQLLVTLACMKGVSLGIKELMVGSVKTDGFHKDGTKDFYLKINELVSFQEGQIKISCPGIAYTTAELVKIANVPPAILHWGHSCHKSNIPCGNCRGCFKNLEVKQELGYD